MNPADHDHPPQGWEAVVGVVLIAAVFWACFFMFYSWRG